MTPALKNAPSAMLVTEFGIVTAPSPAFVCDVISRNAHTPIDVTVDGIATGPKFVSPRNIKLGIDVIPAGNTTLVNVEVDENVCSPNDVTVEGITTDVNRVSRNASFPNEVTDDGNTTEVKPEPLNAASPTPVTPLGNVTAPRQAVFPVTTFEMTVKEPEVPQL